MASKINIRNGVIEVSDFFLSEVAYLNILNNKGITSLAESIGQLIVQDIESFRSAMLTKQVPTAPQTTQPPYPGMSPGVSVSTGSTSTVAKNSGTSTISKNYTVGISNTPTVVNPPIVADDDLGEPMPAVANAPQESPFDAAKKLFG